MRKCLVLHVSVEAARILDWKFILSKFNVTEDSFPFPINIYKRKFKVTLRPLSHCGIS